MSSSLDNLSRNGIINFDPDAYVKEGKEEYAEKSEVYLPLDRPLLNEPQFHVTPGEHLQGAKKDTFESNDGKRHYRNNWGCKLFAGLLGAGALTYGGVQFFKNRSNKASKIKPKEVYTNCKKGVKGWFEKIKAKFTSKDAAKAAETANEAKKGSKFLKGLKITGISLAVLAGLYGIYRLFGGNKHESNHNQSHSEHD